MLKFSKIQKIISKYQNFSSIYRSESLISAEPSQARVQDLVKIFNSKNFKEVLIKVNKLIRSFPQSAVLFNIQGAANAALHKHNAAVASYKKSLILNPSFSGAYNNMSVSQQENGELEAALESSRQAIEMNPDFAEAYLNQGNILHQKGDLKEAINVYSKAIQIRREYADAYNNMGNAQKDLGDLDMAINSYSKAIEIQADYAEAYGNLGIVLRDKGELDKAIEYYRQATSLNPNFSEAHNNLGIALKDKGNLSSAIESYNIAIKINPSYAKAHFHLGMALKEHGNIDGSIESYKNAIKINPNYAEVYSNIGNIFKEKGDIETAIKNYEAAIKIKFDYTEAYYNLGIALTDKGDFDAAIKNYNAVLEIKPDHAEAQHLLVSLLGNTTSSAPREYVERLFDGYAWKFDTSLLGKLDYRIPKSLSEIIIAQKTNVSLGKVLDLGCGTGLLGVELKQYCQSLEGIDLSKLMLHQAQKKNVYDQLHYYEVIEYLSEKSLNFDYFVCADVLIYIGDLSDTFRLIKSRNSRNGKFIFSTEHIEGTGYFLEKTGRYSHSKSYIESLCYEFDYQLSYFTKTKLRKERGEFLTGAIYSLNF